MTARLAAVGAVIAVLVFCGGAALMGGWLLLAAGATVPASCGSSSLDEDHVPPELIPLFTQAAAKYRLGSEGPPVLAALTKVESGFGKYLGPSSAGAIGWTQFMPATWRQYGVDADGDGRRDPMSAPDAIHSAANYLSALGAPRDWRRALYGYNHAGWYVDLVLEEARKVVLEPSPGGDPDLLACAGTDLVAAAGGGRLVGGGRIVAIPGEPGETIDERLVTDVLLLRERYRFSVTDGYATSGHEAAGEHPLGLAVDLVPGPTGTWDDIDALARWAEPTQGRPRPPFRWVGYDGDRNHGRGHHLHLSWDHGPAPGNRPPAPWVRVLQAP